MLKWLRQKWDNFEAWVASKLPGWKTKAVAIAGAIGSAALLFQDYLSGLPLSNVVSPELLAKINIGLFTLAFWFRRLSDKA